MTKRAKIGDWVQIQAEVLPATERASGVPDDTRSLPLLMRVKGFAQTQAALGESMTIETVIGRKMQGALVAIEPEYEHGFGKPIPELLQVGREARKWLNEVSTDV